jgi:hypothetical protein
MAIMIRAAAFSTVGDAVNAAEAVVVVGAVGAVEAE